MYLRKLIFIFYALLLGVVPAFAQSPVTGQVLDEKGNPVADASVIIKGTDKGTVTDGSGNFSMLVATPATLEVSSVNFVTTEFRVNAGGNTLIRLTARNNPLDEVIVVAYGTQKKSSITSAVSTVTAAMIKKQQVVSIGQALQGTASGVMVINSNGQPGSSPNIRIRGVASILASAAPLYVVDGVVFSGSLNMLSPNDIDNFSILKDATASALYGSRGANGVILITTKSGKKNSTPSISLTTIYGVSSRSINDYPYLNTQQQFELGWEALRNNYSAQPDPAQLATNNLVSRFRYNPYGPSFPTPVGTDGKLVAGAVPLWNDNWTDALTRDAASRKDVNIGISGGSDKSRYYLSAGYLQQEGFVSESDFKRISTRFNYITDLNKWLQVGVLTSIVSSKQNYPNQGTNDFSDVVAFGRSMSSVYPIYARDNSGELIKDANGDLIYDFGKPNSGRTVNVNRPVLQGANVPATLVLDDWNFKRLLTDLNTYGQINFTKNLYFKSNFGINRSAVDELDYQNRDFGDAALVGGRVYLTKNTTTSWTWNNMVNYDQTFGNHHLEAMASYEAYRNYFETLLGTKTGFTFSGQQQPVNASTVEDFSGYTEESTLLSYLGRLKYDYAGKYFAEATIRRDRSSIFGVDYRNGWFPAGGVSWIISKEDFMNERGTFDLLKLRVSYGSVGNNGLSNIFPYLSTFGAGYNDLDAAGVYLNNLGNEIIQWERQLNANIGIDFSLLKNRLSGSLDFFDKSSTKLLFAQPLAPSLGFSSIQTNIGKLQNSGVELLLNYSVIQKKELTLDVMFNITYLKNKIKALLPGQDTVAASGPFRQVVGKSLYEYYLPLWAGVDPATGNAQWYANELDTDGNPTGKKVLTQDYNEAQDSQEWVGSGLPKYTGGLSASLRFRNFDLSVLFNYAWGGKYYDNNYSGLMSGFYSFGPQLSTDQLDRWQQPGDITNVPKLELGNNDAQQYSTRFLYSGDYVRLRNITIGYTFNPDRSQKVFKNIRFYILADNIATWDKLKEGSDPESSINGFTNGYAVPFKTISAGLDFTF